MRAGSVNFFIRLEILKDKTVSVADSFFVSNEESGDVKVLHSDGDVYWLEGSTSCKLQVGALSHTHPGNKMHVSASMMFPEKATMLHMEVVVVAKAQ